MPGAGTAEPHVDAFMGQHTNALDRAAHNDAPCSAAAPTGQTGMVDWSDQSRRGSPTKIQQTPARRDPVGANALWVALDSAGQLGGPQTSW